MSLDVESEAAGRMASPGRYFQHEAGKIESHTASSRLLVAGEGVAGLTVAVGWIHPAN